MNTAEDYNDRLQTEESKLNQFNGDERARRADLIALVRREILMMKASRDSDEWKVEERVEGYLNQLEEAA